MTHVPILTHGHVRLHQDGQKALLIGIESVPERAHGLVRSAIMAALVLAPILAAGARAAP